jgi:hypothetical protein
MPGERPGRLDGWLKTAAHTRQQMVQSQAEGGRLITQARTACNCLLDPTGTVWTVQQEDVGALHRTFRCANTHVQHCGASCEVVSHHLVGRMRADNFQGNITLLAGVSTHSWYDMHRPSGTQVTLQMFQSRMKNVPRWVVHARSLC